MTLHHWLKRLIYFQLILSIVGFGLATHGLGIALGALSMTFLAWFVVDKDGGKPIPRTIINLSILLPLFWLVTDMPRFDEGINQDVIIKLGQFILFIQILKLLDRKENRDYVQILVLGLLQMVCASIISISMLFGALMLIYLGAAMMTLFVFQMKISHDRVMAGNLAITPRNRQAPLPDSRRPDRCSRQLAYLSLTQLVICLGIGWVVFLITPRVSARSQINAWFNPQQRTSGFTDQVDLSSESTITPSEEPVLNISLRIRGELFGSQDYSFHLRGSTMDLYDSRTNKWERGPHSNSDRTIHPGPGKYLPLISGVDATQLLNQEITLRTGSRVLFTVYPPVSVRTDQNTALLFNPVDQVLQNRREQTMEIRYNVDSLIRHHPRHLAGYYTRFDSNLPPDARPPTNPADPSATRTNRPQYARGPVVPNPRIREYTLELLAAANLGRDESAIYDPRDTQIARMLEEHLRSTCRYSLTPPSTPRDMDPISGFLFESKRGHCEYFASALCAMTRSIGMTSRMVGGYHVSEFNSVGYYYVVRQKNAHAWVEVLTQEQGWVTYDASPPQEIASSSRATGGLWGTLVHLYDFIEFQWVSSVIAYDTAQQRNLFRRYEAFITEMTEWLQWAKANLLEWIEELGNWISPGELGQAAAWGLVVLVAGLPFYLLYRFLRGLWRSWKVRRWSQASPVVSRELVFYPRMLRILRKAGFRRENWEPPGLFAGRVLDQSAELGALVQSLTDAFYQVRFGGRLPDAAWRHSVEQGMSRLKQSIKA